MNQLTSIPHNIFQVFDANLSLEAHRLFLDFPKAFHIVWNKGLLQVHFSIMSKEVFLVDKLQFVSL